MGTEPESSVASSSAIIRAQARCGTCVQAAKRSVAAATRRYKRQAISRAADSSSGTTGICANKLSEMVGVPIRLAWFMCRRMYRRQYGIPEYKLRGIPHRLSILSSVQTTRVYHHPWRRVAPHHVFSASVDERSSCWKYYTGMMHAGDAGDRRHPPSTPAQRIRASGSRTGQNIRP